ncbi:glycine betaine ABC transporter substrate-binding protein [uncultured Veillonella sp.]|uniref:ABC transporter permease/substrate-binding protein n=1 Tax=uncultured Veillonella sp. TaxID=159268 RepID=UPI0026360DAD|nr:glycine betaine ABC transporter substrate-binding protein [uncultured Veillonella sp.]
MGIFDYMIQNYNQVGSLLLEHIRLTAVAVGLAILVGVPLGIMISYVKSLNKPIMGATNLIQAVPSMALLGFAIPLLGIGTLPAVIVVFLYSLLPIVKNTYIGISQIKPGTIEAAKGIGMTRAQILWRVQLPLTLPVLMAGVRISAVTAVGLMTIAAFIGAGGLGFLVFSGISSVNNGMIMAGAVPACILALFIDWILSYVEALVTPVSLQPNLIGNKEKVLSSRKRQKWIVGVVAALVVVLLGTSAYGALAKDKNVIRVGSKQFTEQLILGNMLSEMIEKNTDLKVERHLGAGGTQVLYSAMKSDDLDAYIEYTGTVYVDMLKHTPKSDAKAVYEESKAELADAANISMLEAAPFSNTYTLAVSEDLAKEYNLTKMSDLARVGSNLNAGTTLEFLNREDGLAGVNKAYGFTFKDAKGIDGATRYVALENGTVQVVDAFSTDGLLKKYGLTVLEDDKQFFPPYYGVPLIRAEVIEEHPDLEPLINQMMEKLDTKTMQELNYEVDVEHKSPEEVAHNYLVSAGLVK